jgi:cystathionine beta-lyase
MLLSRLLSNHLPAAKYIPPEATYLAWLNCREVGFSEQAAATFLRYGKVALDPGEAYGSGGSGYVRLNFATSPDILTEIVARMARAVSEFRR